MPSSSDQKPMIYVQTLGGFSIKTGDLQINDNRNQSKKPWALLEYLIVFQKKEISPAELIHIIWATVRATGDLPTKAFSPAKRHLCLDPGISYSP